MPIKIYYPSGRNAVVHARFVKKGPWGSELFMVVFEVTQLSRAGDSKLQPGEMLVVDPRCVCVDQETGQTIYDGRQHLEQMPADMAEWLREHPEWPGVLEL